MKTRFIALALVAASSFALPAIAQTQQEQQRWDAAQTRYQTETNLYQQERDRYFDARARDRYGNSNSGPPSRFATNYDAARDYRDDPRYQERKLGPDDQVYRGSDGRYYCKRSDGTTGLILGGAAGGILGNVIDGGHNRIGGTLIGGALGALLGRSIDQNSANNDIRCR